MHSHVAFLVTFIAQIFIIEHAFVRAVPFRPFFNWGNGFGWGSFPNPFGGWGHYPGGFRNVPSPSWSPSPAWNPPNSGFNPPSPGFNPPNPGFNPPSPSPGFNPPSPGFNPGSTGDNNQPTTSPGGFSPSPFPGNINPLPAPYPDASNEVTPAPSPGPNPNVPIQNPEAAPPSGPAQSPATTPAPSNTAGPSSLTADQQAVLNYHNEVRRQEGAGPLQWDPDLAIQSLRWAQGCAQKHDMDNFVKQTLFKQENLHRSQAKNTMADGAWWWYREKYGGGITGHYENMVNRAFTLVGCGQAVCQGKAMPYETVCRYK